MRTPFLQDGFSLPYSVWDNTTTQGMKLLADSHSQLMKFHATKNISFDAKTTNTLPTQAVVAFWDPSISWSGGAWHSKVKRASKSPLLLCVALLEGCAIVALGLIQEATSHVLDLGERARCGFLGHEEAPTNGSETLMQDW